ncbi:Abi family protein [Moraxella sp. ZJ142]|uniref:Abi family protein n=1 Tax=Moraxella marmotae TaxID=3344520 RepID=UPI0035D4B6B0
MKASNNYKSIQNSLSQARLATYEKFTKDYNQALDLYRWNLQISSALFECLAICEVSIRNGVSTAIQAEHGDEWAFNARFLKTLKGNRRDDVIRSQRNHSTTEKILADLPFVFWQSMFTVRFDDFWCKYLIGVLPNADSKDLKKLREEMFIDLNRLRKLRNRIAHHEPIFNRNLQSDFNTIMKVIKYCNWDLCDWISLWQRVEELLKNKPC